MSVTIEYASLTERGRALITQSRKFLAGLKHGLIAKRTELSAEVEKPSPSAVQRADTLAQIDQAARNGFVPDAHVLRLYDSHMAELAEMRCQLGEAEAGHQAALRQLDAMFPEPPAPLPEPPAPPTPKSYPRMGDLFGGNGKASPLH
jgi:hypothetical protein